MSLYRGYFVPGTVDPTGQKVAVLHGYGGIWSLVPYFNHAIEWQLEEAEYEKIDELIRVSAMARALADICDDSSNEKKLLELAAWAEWYITDIHDWTPESRSHIVDGSRMPFPFEKYETGKGSLLDAFMHGVSVGCEVGLSTGGAGGMPKNPFSVFKNNPRFLYGMSLPKLQNLLGKGWRLEKYGDTGTGWKLINNKHPNQMIFRNSGGTHGGDYWGISGAGKRRIKLVSEDYIPEPSDKAKIICCGCKKLGEIFK